MARFTTDHWETAIAEVQSDDVLIRGESLTSLIASESFGGMAYRVLSGRRASVEQARMLEAVMVAIMEHGISPSTTVTRMMASYGVPIQAGIAAGNLTVGDHHGGANEQIAADFRMVIDRVDEDVTDREGALDAAALAFVRDRRAVRQPVDGFGHPQHGADPRVGVLLGLSRELGIYSDGCYFLQALERALETELGRRLPANIDGVSAAIIIDLGLDPRAARPILMAPRTIGLAAHFLEELDQGGKWRHVPGDQVTYTGARANE